MGGWVGTYQCLELGELLLSRHGVLLDLGDVVHHHHFSLRMSSDILFVCVRRWVGGWVGGWVGEWIEGEAGCIEEKEAV